MVRARVFALFLIRRCSRFIRHSGRGRRWPRDEGGSKILVKCERCSAEFEVHPSRLKHGRGKHCSRECQYKAIRERPNTKLKLVCVGCGNPFERNRQPDKNGSGKYCNRKCRDKNWKGAATPNWQGGNGVYRRGTHWHSIRRAIIERDGFKCTECFSTKELNVHHKIPFRMFDNVDNANALGNLITLCKPCHRTEDAKYKWIKFDEGVLQFNSQGPAWQMSRQLKQRI